jgi:hypothetical protein
VASAVTLLAGRLVSERFDAPIEKLASFSMSN